MADSRQPQPIDTLILPRWIAPVEPAETLLEDHAIAVHEGHILDLLPRGEALRCYAAQETVELPGHLLIPGLVNAHTHAAMSLFRGLADDLPLKEWLEGHIWPAEQRWAGPDFVRDGTALALAEMIRSGTTCFNDMYFFPDQTARVANEAGMRAVVGLIVIDFPTAWARDTAEYFRKGEQLHDHYRNNPLIRTAFAPHAPYSVCDDSLSHIAVIAEELDIPVHIHLLETRHEVEQSREQHGEHPMQRLQRLGLLSPRLVAVHMTALEEADIALAAEHGIHVVHCPHSNLKLASGFCPVQRLLENGVHVALGTDGAASNNRLDLLAEMRAAALLAKAVSGDASALPHHRALELATLGGARALGLEEKIGSLRPGKAADLVAVELECPETWPIHDPVSQLVYAAGREQVREVWVAGRRLLQKGRLCTLDLPVVMEAAGEWALRIARTDREEGKETGTE